MLARNEAFGVSSGSRWHHGPDRHRILLRLATVTRQPCPPPCCVTSSPEVFVHANSVRSTNSLLVAKPYELGKFRHGAPAFQQALPHFGYRYRTREHGRTAAYPAPLTLQRLAQLVPRDIPAALRLEPTTVAFPVDGHVHPLVDRPSPSTSPHDAGNPSCDFSPVRASTNLELTTHRRHASAGRLSRCVLRSEAHLGKRACRDHVCVVVEQIDEAHLVVDDPGEKQAYLTPLIL